MTNLTCPHCGGDVPLAPGLTADELKVSELVRRGAPNSAIAEQMGWTEEDAKRAVRRVCEKVGVVTRVQLTMALGGPL